MNQIGWPAWIVPPSPGNSDRTG